MSHHYVCFWASLQTPLDRERMKANREALVGWRVPSCSCAEDKGPCSKRYRKQFKSQGNSRQQLCHGQSQRACTPKMQTRRYHTSLHPHSSSRRHQYSRWCPPLRLGPRSVFAKGSCANSGCKLLHGPVVFANHEFYSVSSPADISGSLCHLEWRKRQSINSVQAVYRARTNISTRLCRHVIGVAVAALFFLFPFPRVSLSILVSIRVVVAADISLRKETPLGRVRLQFLIRLFLGPRTLCISKWYGLLVPAHLDISVIREKMSFVQRRFGWAKVRRAASVRDCARLQFAVLV